MRDPKLPTNLSISELIDCQISHARSLGADEPELARYRPFAEAQARAFGRDLFWAQTSLLIATDFCGAFKNQVVKDAKK